MAKTVRINAQELFTAVLQASVDLAVAKNDARAAALIGSVAGTVGADCRAKKKRAVGQAKRKSTRKKRSNHKKVAAQAMFREMYLDVPKAKRPKKVNVCETIGKTLGVSGDTVRTKYLPKE